MSENEKCPSCSLFLTEQQIEEIAEKASQKAIEKMTKTIYTEVGKGVVTNFFYIVGVISVVIYTVYQYISRPTP